MARVLLKSGRMNSDHATPTGPAPDPDATGGPRIPHGNPGAPGRETLEREAAWRRGQLAREGDEPTAAERERDPYSGLAAPGVASRAFATLADNVRDYAIFLMDPDGVITFWGEGARLMKWWTRAEAEGGHLRMLYPDGGSQDGTAEAHLRQAAERGEYTGEGQRMRSDGSTFWGGITLTALRDDAGVLLGFAKVTRDLTAHRAAEAVLKAASEDAERARRQAEEANRAKSLFLATMSHEIRTPINAVMGYVDLLDMEIAGSLNEVQRGQLGRIRASNMHLLGIIDEILDFSRLDAGRVALDRRAARLGAPIDAAIQMVAVQAQSKGVGLSDAVSGYAADVPYWGNEDRVRQILVVLLSNAVKFTPSRGRVTVSAGTTATPSADARLDGPGPWVYVRIEDTGPGIPLERIAAIFEPFEQADMTLTRQHGGTGLGLTIAKRLALLMGGDLTVRSQPGVGSAFFLWLPAAPEESVVSSSVQTSEVDAAGPGLLQSVRDALVVELERVLHGYVARLRSDPATPSAHSLSEAELEDHLATFLADLASTFHSLQLAEGEASASLRDGSEIQRMVAERHGAQRRRLGWAADEVRREFTILSEEVSAAIQRRVDGSETRDLDGALEAVGGFIEAARRVSLAAHELEPV
jgi:PAS domain S-box-containing protein